MITVEWIFFEMFEKNFEIFLSFLREKFLGGEKTNFACFCLKMKNK
jgi:hypothetical protein